MKFQLPSPLQQLAMLHDYETYIKRDDLIHPEVSGNKYRKLKGYLEGRSIRKVITFGGAFSNHVHATAAFCHKNDLDCIAYIRGLDADMGNPTLQDVQEWGCQIKLLSREDYRKYRSNPEVLSNYGEQEVACIAEGGWGVRGLTGLRSLAEELDKQLVEYDYIILPVGTATTLIGLATYLKSKVTIIGVRAVKDNELDLKIQSTTRHVIPTIRLLKGYEWGGFAKYDDKLLQYMDDIHEKYGLSLDFVYNAKAFFAMEKLMDQHYFRKGSRIVYIHTGGLQGNRGLSYHANKM